MNELIKVLDTLFGDLDSAELDLEKAVISNPDHPFFQEFAAINSNIWKLKDLTSALLEKLNNAPDRVYYIRTSTEVDSYIRVHAKNQRDAIQLACNVIESRIESGMSEFKFHTYTEGEQAVDYGNEDEPVFAFPYAKTE
jgi:hypothetical protein